MLLKRAAAIGAGVFVLAAPCSGRADIVSDIIGFPLKAVLGSSIDKVQGSADEVISNANGVVNNANRVVSNANGLVNNASAALTVHETRISDLANALVTHTDNALDARILQIKTSADDSVERALSQVQTVGHDLINRVQKLGSGLIEQADKSVLGVLDDADTKIRQRTADIDKVLEDRTTQIDQAVADRIAQADEVVGRRLGDVDVIASQQRIALESALIRIAVIIGALVFVVFVMLNLWRRYDALSDEELAEKRGARRTAFLLGKLAPALVGPTLAALCGVALLGALYRWLPSGALQEQSALTLTHQRQLADAAQRIDYPRARFEASHLGYLDPANAASYEGLADKTGLVRDFLARPGLVGTRAGIAAFEERVTAAERLLAPHPDPDLLTLRAMLTWKTGSTRRAEHAAASLAARALELSPNGFGLSPLARAYVATFLNQPYIAPDAGEGRDAASIDELSNALSLAAPDPAESALAGLAELTARMRALEAESTENYVMMAKANAAVVLAKENGDTSALQAQLQIRTEKADAVIKAWQKFDQKLQESSDVKGRLILNIFGLDDALLSRALWFDLYPASTASHGTRIVEVAAPMDRARLAPARIAWTRRYGDLLGDPARQVFEQKQTEQFQSWERWAIEFEDALIAHAEAAPGPAEPAARWRVVVAAAALGLYVDGPRYRVPYARTFAATLQDAPLAPAVTATKPNKSTDDAARVPRVTDAPATLEGLLGTRGQRLI